MLSKTTNSEATITLTQRIGKVDLGTLALVFYIFTTIVMNEGEFFNLVSKGLLVAVFLLESFREKVKPIPFIGVATVFVGYSALSVVWSLTPDTSISRVLTLVNQLVCYSAVLYLVSWRKNRLSYCLTCFVASAVVSAIFVILVQGVTFQENRYSDGSVSSGQLALSCAISMSICIYRFVTRKDKKYLALFIGLLFALILTSGRRGFIYIVVFAILFGLAQSKDFNKKFIYTIVIAVVLCIVLALCMTNEFLYSYIGVRIESFLTFVFQGYSGDSSIQGRARLINYGIQLFTQSPIVGNGIDSFSVLFMNQEASWDTSADNNYIELLSDLGIVGFFLYYVPLATFLIKNFLGFPQRSNSVKFSLIALLSMCAIDFASVWFFSKVGMLFIVFLYALVREDSIQVDGARVESNHDKVLLKGLAV